MNKTAWANWIGEFERIYHQYYPAQDVPGMSYLGRWQTGAKPEEVVNEIIAARGYAYCPECQRRVKNLYGVEGSTLKLCKKCKQAKGKVGRPKLRWGETEYLNVKITPAMRDYAKRLGGGNEQEGIRRALAYAMEHYPAPLDPPLPIP